MSLNYPTLVPRAKAAAEKRESDEAAAEKRAREAERNRQSAIPNRGVTAPPAFGPQRGPGSALGLFS